MFTAPTGSFAAGGLVPVLLTISTDQCSYNYFVASGSPPYPVALTIHVEAGVTVYNLFPGAGFAVGSTCHILNEGDILGQGGAGGMGGTFDTGTVSPGEAGGPGGNALTLGMNTTINNGSGNIWGGGGGAGGGGATVDLTDLAKGAAGGGGGGGVEVSPCGGGAGGARGFNSRTPPAGEGEDGAVAIAPDGGLGGAGGLAGPDHVFIDRYAGDGGVGGGWGGIGGSGWEGYNLHIDWDGQAGGAGGAAGKAVNLAGFTADFTSGGTAPNVVGAVS